MKLPILVRYEIDVDNTNQEHCGECSFMPNPPLCNLFGLNICQSRTGKREPWIWNRCQACLDAEKEGK